MPVCGEGPDPGVWCSRALAASGAWWAGAHAALTEATHVTPVVPCVGGRNRTWFRDLPSGVLSPMGKGFRSRGQAEGGRSDGAECGADTRALSSQGHAPAPTDCRTPTWVSPRAAQCLGHATSALHRGPSGRMFKLEVPSACQGLWPGNENVINNCLLLVNRRKIPVLIAKLKRLKNK